MVSYYITISVIVPVYNAEKYIEECVSSIINQSFSNFELLLIDDGSTDSSGALCDSFAEKDSRIKVFHKKNEGASSARNLGIEKANGEWISFVDSDDFIDKDYLKLLIENSANVEVVSCENYWTDEKGNILSRNVKKRGYIDKSDFYKAINKDWCNIASMGHLINKELIKEKSIYFEIGRNLGEDTIFVIQTILSATRILNIAEPLYFYRSNPNSLVHPSKDRIQRYIDDSIWIVEKIEQIGHEKLSLYKKKKMNTLLLFLYKNKREMVAEILKKDKMRLRFVEWLSLSYKEKILMFYMLFPKSMQFFVMNLLFKFFLKG